MIELVWLNIIILIVRSNLCFCESFEQRKWNKIALDDLKEALINEPIMNKAKNVIFFLGDGMDLTTLTTSRILKGQLKNKLGLDDYLVFERFPHVALMKTYTIDRQVPDSAATATAYLTGVKGNYGTVGVDSNVKRFNCSSYRRIYDTKSIFYHALRENKAVGLVTTTRVTHATPSALYAHTPNRNWEDNQQRDEMVQPKLRSNCPDVATQLLKLAIDYKVILGGGRRSFLPNNVSDPEYPDQKGRRTDGRNLIQEWIAKQKSRGRKANYVWRKKEFDAIKSSDNQYIMGLFEPSHMQYDILRNDSQYGEPSIAEMTAKAIAILSQNNENGFFLFVEGGRIDHAHHDTKAKLALTETLALEKAVIEALSMTNEKETLILVGADHTHVFTFGAYAGAKNGIFDLTDHDEEGKGIGIAKDNLPYTSLIYANGPKAALNNGKRENISRMDLNSPNYQQQAAIPLTEESHGGEDITIFARGPMSHLLHRVHEQNYIAHVIKYAACIGEYAGSQCMKLKPLVSNKGSLATLKFSKFIHFSIGFVLLNRYL